MPSLQNIDPYWSYKHIF